MNQVIPASWAPVEAERIGNWIRERRETQGLGRLELAERMGYQNLDHGCSRIASWESHRDYPRGDRVATLCNALDLDARPLAMLVSAFLEEGRRTRRTLQDESDRQYRVGRAELELLCKYHGLLVEHRSDILAAERLSMIRIGSSRVQLSLVGATTLTLGELLRGWQDGSLVVPTESGPLFVLRLAGSPLSGGGSVVGFRTGGTALEVTRITGCGRRALPVLQAARGCERPASAWSLSQLLCSLGVEVPDIRFSDPDGRVVWRYRYETGEISGPAGVLDLRLMLEAGSLNGRAWWAPHWDQSASESLTIGQVAPLQGGRWTGEFLQIRDSSRHTWSAPPGTLYRPGGALRYRISAIASPAVLGWLVEEG